MDLDRSKAKRCSGRKKESASHSPPKKKSRRNDVENSLHVQLQGSWHKAVKTRDHQKQQLAGDGAEKELPRRRGPLRKTVEAKIDKMNLSTTACQIAGGQDKVARQCSVKIHKQNYFQAIKDVHASPDHCTAVETHQHGSRLDHDIKELYELIPGRKAQIDMMTVLLNKANKTLCPAVYVYGDTATGKSLVVRKVLEVMKIPTAYVNCGECYNVSVLCEAIIHQLSGLSSSSKFSLTRCDNVSQFIKLLKGVIDERISCDPTCIVIDKAERLCTLQGTMIFTLFRLQELCQRNICVILLSRTEWSIFSYGVGYLQPMIMHFPNYSRMEVLKILSLDCNDEKLSDLHHKFLGHLWEVFNAVCRSLNELRYLSLMLFPKYKEPVVKGEIQLSEGRKLWQRVNPFFKQALSSLCHHSINRSESELPAKEVDNTADAEELPYHTKFLLIASFLASYNVAKTDEKYFSEQKEIKKKRSGNFKASTKTSTQLLGPNTFPFNRLIKIFQSISDDKVTLPVHLISQVRSLITLGFLTCVSKSDQLENSRYKCMVSLDFILMICRTVQFNLSQYLQ